MPLGNLEPLYRYLQANDRSNAVSRLIGDMEALAKGGYIRSESPGIHRVVTSHKISAEVRECVEQAFPKIEVANFHVMCQSIDDEFYLAVSRVNEKASKTCLSLVIKRDDTVKLEYIEPGAFEQRVQGKHTTYSSVNTVICSPDGTKSSGFIRYETTFKFDRGRHGSAMAIMIDFKMTRAAPIYIFLADICDESSRVTVGRHAKEAFESMGE